jgi:hypothetical protein
MPNWDCDTAPENRLLPESARALGPICCFIYTGPSMLPTFRPGQLLYVRAGLQHLEPGDVIVFTQSVGRGHVTHRIIAAAPAGFITRGDNNVRVDNGVVSFEHVIGRVEMVEDHGQIKPVRGGQRALWLAQMGWGARRVEYWVRVICGAPYRALRASPLARRILQRIIRLRFAYVSVQTAQGTLVKTLHRGKVVARWYPATRRFECRKPYDLVLAPPDSP